MPRIFRVASRSPAALAPRPMHVLVLPLALALTVAVSAQVGKPAAREAAVELPASVSPGAPFEVGLLARTTAGGGERVGFLHAEITADGGRTWTPLAMEQDLPAEVRRAVRFVAPDAGTLRVRLRVAFRGGLAGDVDQNGAALRWTTDWVAWRSPPTVVAETMVRPPG